MVSRITFLLSCVAIATVRAQQTSQAPLEPREPCLYADCGVKDVTPSSLDNTNNTQKYRILSKIGSSIFIGGLQEFIKIDPTCGTDPWIQRSIQIESCIPDSGSGLPCSSLAGNSNPTLVCDNYIRIVEEVNGKLLVCGTNSAFPRCYSFTNDCALTSDGTNLNGGNCVDEESYDARSTYDLAPRNFDQNTTLSYFGTELFIGSTSEISTDKSFVGKVEVTGTLGQYGTSPFGDRVDTYTIEARSVNEANFVGQPYEYTDGSDFVLFFFRETAVEHINQGKIVYSRVARVCKDDMGSAGKWSSYLKARLNCSRPGLYPEDLDEIQDVTVTTIDGKVYFYAVFTQPPNAPPQSAVCIYSLEDIHNNFQNSQFKSPASSNALWLPVAVADVPSPRPGFDCSNPSSSTTFIQNTPLMNDLVENFNYKPELQQEDASDNPLFFHNGARFSRITVDNRGGTSFEDAVIFIGTESGEVWKVTDSDTGNAADDLVIVELWESSDGSPITGLEYVESAGKTYLYATTNDQIIQIDLQHGQAQTKSQFELIYSPYIEAVPPGFSATNVLVSHKLDVVICDNSEVMILCEGNLDPQLNMAAQAGWTFTSTMTGITSSLDDSGLGHFISREPLYNTSDPLNYIVIKTHSRTEGNYTCTVSMGDETEESETSTVIVKNCITNEAISEREHMYKEERMQSDERKRAFEQQNGECQVDVGKCEDTCPWFYTSP